jgi:hypothetical protein
VEGAHGVSGLKMSETLAVVEKMRSRAKYEVVFFEENSPDSGNHKRRENTAW